MKPFHGQCCRVAADSKIVLHEEGNHPALILTQVAATNSTVVRRPVHPGWQQEEDPFEEFRYEPDMVEINGQCYEVGLFFQRALLGVYSKPLRYHLETLMARRWQSN